MTTWLTGFELGRRMSRDQLVEAEYAPTRYLADESDAIVAVVERDGVLRVEPIELYAELRAS
jgi:hypothetical protein